jgi:hypothetical protein
LLAINPTWCVRHVAIAGKPAPPGYVQITQQGISGRFNGLFFCLEEADLYIS